MSELLRGRWRVAWSVWKMPDIAGPPLPKSVVSCFFPACFPLGIGACIDHAEEELVELVQVWVGARFVHDALVAHPGWRALVAGDRGC